MEIIDVHEAKMQLSRLINEVISGEEIIIAKSGHPLVKLIPYEERVITRKAGTLKGLMTVGPDFNAPLPGEISKAFEDGITSNKQK